MKPIKNLAQYYVDLLVKLGIVRFSILLALALVALAVFVQVGITLALQGMVDDIDINPFRFLWSSDYTLGCVLPFRCG